MQNFIESWDELNEGYAKAKGRHIIPVNGKRIKLVYKAQNDKQIMFKLIKAQDIINNGVMTSLGAKALLNFINSQIGLVNSYGKMDSNFFKKNVLIYKVVKDTNRLEKVQITIVERSQIQGLDPNAQFVSTDAIKKSIAIDQPENTVIKDVVSQTEEKAASDNTAENPEEVKSGKADDAKGTSATARVSGVRFRYEMRSNGTVYSMEFTEDGAIDCMRAKGSGVNGQVSWENNAPFWYTDTDNTEEAFKKALNSSDPLAIDIEITNQTDREFFTKIFTDDEFLQKIIDEYNEKYAKQEINGDTLKDMLYHFDRTKIFGETAIASDAQSGESVTGTVSAGDDTVGKSEQYGGIHKAG